MVKEKLPLAVGVPEITPVDEFSPSPIGSEPETILYVIGASPPEVCICCE